MELGWRRSAGGQRRRARFLARSIVRSRMRWIREEFLIRGSFCDVEGRVDGAVVTGLRGCVCDPRFQQIQASEKDVVEARGGITQIAWHSHPGVERHSFPTPPK